MSNNILDISGGAALTMEKRSSSFKSLQNLLRGGNTSTSLMSNNDYHHNHIQNSDRLDSALLSEFSTTMKLSSEER